MITNNNNNNISSTQTEYFMDVPLLLYSWFCCFFYCFLQEKLHERAKQNLPVFQDLKCVRNPGDTSTLDSSEVCLKELVRILSMSMLRFPKKLSHGKSLWKMSNSRFSIAQTLTGNWNPFDLWRIRVIESNYRGTNREDWKIRSSYWGFE